MRKLYRRVIDWLWVRWPIRCITCRRWFTQGDFWNPWGPNKGPGLACSRACCEAAVPRSTEGMDE